MSRFDSSWPPEPAEIGFSPPRVAPEDIPPWAKGLGKLDSMGPLGVSWGWYLAGGIALGLFLSNMDKQHRRKG